MSTSAKAVCWQSDEGLDMAWSIQTMTAATPSKLEPRDLLSAIRVCTEDQLPAAMGTCSVLVEAEATMFRNSGKTIDCTVTIDADMTLEAATLPPQISDVPFLAGLPWVLVTVVPTGELEASIHNPETGEDEDALLDDPAENLFYVPSTPFLQALWKHYHVNLESLQAALHAIQYEARGRVAEWHKARDVLAHKAFGHTPETGKGILFNAVFEEGTATKWLPHVVRSRATENSPYSPFPCPTSGYYALVDVYYLAALLDLIKAQDVLMPLPSNECAIVFSDDGVEKAAVYLLDTWEPPKNPPLPLEARKEYGKTSDLISEIFRYRYELSALREQRKELLDEAFSLGLTPPGGKYVRTMTQEDSEKQHALITEARGLYQEDAEIQEKALAVYCKLTEWASKHKEKVSKAVRDREATAVRVIEGKEAIHSRGFVALPNNMDRLPAHFAAIPSGLESGLHLEKDQFGRSILRVRRQGLQLAGAHQPPAQEQMQFSIVAHGPDSEHEAALAQAQMLFGANGPRWLVPQGIVAVSKLYSDLGGYHGAESVVRLHLNDWIDTMRPLQVERFRQKGRGEAFGKEHKPRDLFQALLGVLNRLTYDSQVNSKLEGWSELSGFYLILASGEDSRGPWAEVMLNPTLHRFIAGDGGLPYMITNTKAMFEYDRASLDYAPAAQMGLEQFARTNLYKRTTSTISDPQGGGITRYELAQRFGILRGLHENNKDVMKRFNRVLDNLGKAGVLADVKVDGQDRTGDRAFETKLLITMHEDYRKAYDLGRDKEKLEALDRQLATPFADAKKVRQSYLATPNNKAGKKRGRPPKAKP